MPAPTAIPVDPTTLRRLRNAYREAERQGKKPDDVIKVMGYEFVMNYLKYLIEFMEMHLARNASRPIDRNILGR